MPVFRMLKEWGGFGANKRKAFSMAVSLFGALLSYLLEPIRSLCFAIQMEN